MIQKIWKQLIVSLWNSRQEHENKFVQTLNKAVNFFKLNFDVS